MPYSKHFQTIAHLVTYKTNRPLVNYLDYYFFAALYKALCDGQVQIFLDICHTINFPVSLEKTFWGTQLLTFLGLLIDTIAMRICIPADKLAKAMELVDYVLNKRNKKITLHQLQQLTGFLNFLCKCVIPGRSFLRRLYSLGSNEKLMPHHHIRLNAECRMDMEIWKKFLSHPSIFSRPFLDCFQQTSDDIDMYSDASGAGGKGFGAYCGTKWSYMPWNVVWLEDQQPSIEYLELYGVTVAVLLWIKNFKNSRILLHCDNESACKMINKGSSGCRNCMVLIRIIVLECMVHNVHLTAEWISTGDNGKADALSRLDWKRFNKLGPDMDAHPTPVPLELWPIDKIWIYN